MESHSFSDMAGLEAHNWWYVSRRRLLERLLNRYGAPDGIALDLGCGVGSHFSLLERHAKECIGLDISAEALQYAKRCSYTQLLEGSVEKIPLPNSSISIVLCADVLEHVDDAQTLKEIFRVLKPGGMLYVTVPAFQSLWHENDDYSHHMRRYARHELHERVVQTGFTVMYFNFWNLTFFLPVWCTARMYHKKEGHLQNNLTRVPRFLNGILTVWMHAENFVGSRFPLPIGVSQVLVAQKP